MINPLYDHIVVRQKGSDGTIGWGRVIAVGPGRNIDGTFIKPHVKDGDLVYFSLDGFVDYFKSHEVYFDLAILREAELLGIEHE